MGWMDKLMEMSGCRERERRCRWRKVIRLQRFRIQDEDKYEGKEIK
jgi:hypothetical protein